MKKNNGMFDDLKEKPSFLIKCWWKIENFVNDWIYPGYNMKNFLFHNYNEVKLPMFKSYEYVDISERMKFAIFELIKDFIEKEHPEKHIIWYGEFGHKYGEGPSNILSEFDQKRGKYVMDLIKDIYNFYTKELPRLEKEKDYLLTIWSTYILNGHYKEDEKLKDVVEWIDEPTNYTLEDLEKENIDWNIVLKFIEKKENFFNEHLIYNKYREQEKLIRSQIQYYLHLAIEIREFLWT